MFRSVSMLNHLIDTASRFCYLVVHPEIVDFGSRQGHRIFSTAGVVSLRRGSKKSENAVLGRKMLFLDGHYLTPIAHQLKRHYLEAAYTPQ